MFIEHWFQNVNLRPEVGQLIDQYNIAATCSHGKDEGRLDCRDKFSSDPPNVRPTALYHLSKIFAKEKELFHSLPVRVNVHFANNDGTQPA